MNYFKLFFSLPFFLFLTVPQNTYAEEKSTIKLFVYNGCPFCKKVIDHLKTSENLQKVAILSADEPENFLELKRLSGDTQVPFLYDEEKDVKMSESDDIIEYFKTRFL